MLLIEGNGIAIGLHVDSARPNELKLVEATLESVRVSARLLWRLTSSLIARTCVAVCVGGAFSPTSRPWHARTASRPSAVAPCGLAPFSATAGRWNVPLLG